MGCSISTGNTTHRGSEIGTNVGVVGMGAQNNTFTNVMDATEGIPSSEAPHENVSKRQRGSVIAARVRRAMTANRSRGRNVGSAEKQAEVPSQPRDKRSSWVTIMRVPGQMKRFRKEAPVGLPPKSAP